MAEKSFFFSRPKLIHIASNIALSPILVYLIGLWPWPPALPHLIVFIIAGAIALRYVKKRWATPQMVINEHAIHCGGVYSFDDIVKVEQVMRSLRITARSEQGEETQVVGLGWAKRADFEEIISIVNERVSNRG
jgi:hypothetical protein